MDTCDGNDKYEWKGAFGWIEMDMNEIERLNWLSNEPSTNQDLDQGNNWYGFETSWMDQNPIRK